MKRYLVKETIRFTVLAVMIWGVLTVLASFVRITPVWPLATVALVVAASVSLILWLYRYEMSAVAPGRARLLVTLRMTALAVLVWILIDPVWVRKTDREARREVVIVMDESASMHLKDDGAQATRSEIANQAVKDAKLIETLEKSLRVRVVKAARSIQAEGEKVAEGWGDSTDLASALGTVLDQVPPDELAGVILASDGRHNRPERVEDVVRRFGILDAPVAVIAVGSETPPRDASVLSVRAPEAIHLGDRMRVTAELKFDGYKGQTAKAYLRRGEKILEQREIPVPQDHHVEEVRFANVPDKGGVNDYRVEIGQLEGERFKDNNGWDFETSITDARTNVLIVENYPRWEFRYLRNLFYGRDKSVHLQYVLMNPDQVSFQENPAVPASASRPFGDALATRLPVNEEEWRKFDVIIMGDVDPKTLDEKTWQIVSRCVNDRAALLVMIAGPRFMPHAIDAPAGRALVPAEMEFSQRNYFTEGGENFRFGLTMEGRRHPVTQQGDGEMANEKIWSGFPALNWRHPLTGLKEGAEVLLTAQDTEDRAEIGGGAGLAGALDDLAKRREREAKTALLVTRQTGKGKVALLLTDRTWRMREGAGDLYHHRFWGNLVRWGAGPVLRAGGSRARLGTDQLTYTPDDRAKITARLRDKDLNPVTDPSLEAEVLKDGTVLSTVKMTAVKDSNGLYEANLDRFPRAGKYEVRLKGGKADDLIRQDNAGPLKAGFQVVGSRGPVELAETTLNRPLLETIAQLSGGKVVNPEKAGDLPPLFLTEKNQREEIRETSLWDSGWVMGLLALLLGSEWAVRRAAGLP